MLRGPYKKKSLEERQVEMREWQKLRLSLRKRPKNYKRKSRRKPRVPKTPHNQAYLKKQARIELKKTLYASRRVLKKRLSDRARYRRILKEKRSAVALLKFRVQEFATELRAAYQEVKDCAALLRGARTSYAEKLPSEVAKALSYSKGFVDGKAALLAEQSSLTQK